MNFWLTKIGDVPLPQGEFSLDTSRALTNDVAPVIGAQGIYYLNGARPLVGGQNYTYEYTVQGSACNAHLDALLQVALAEQSIYKTNGDLTLDTVARISAVTDATTINDIRSGTKRLRLAISAEPFWYGKTRTLALDIGGTNPKVVAVSDGPNAALNWGTAPSIKHTRFTGSNSASTAALTLAIYDNGTLYTTLSMGAMSLAEVPWYIDAGVPEVIGTSTGNQWRYVTRPSTQVPLMAIPPVGRLGGRINTAYVWSVSLTDANAKFKGTLTWRDCYF